MNQWRIVVTMMYRVLVHLAFLTLAVAGCGASQHVDDYWHDAPPPPPEPPAPLLTTCDEVFEHQYGRCLLGAPACVGDSDPLQRISCSCELAGDERLVASRDGVWSCTSSEPELTLRDLPGERMRILRDLGTHRIGMWGKGGPVRAVHVRGTREVEGDLVAFADARVCPGQSLEGSYVVSPLDAKVTRVQLMSVDDSKQCGQPSPGCRNVTPYNRARAFQSFPVERTIRTADLWALKRWDDAAAAGESFGFVQNSYNGDYRVSGPDFTCHVVEDRTLLSPKKSRRHNMAKPAEIGEVHFYIDHGACRGKTILRRGTQGIGHRFADEASRKSARVVLLKDEAAPKCTTDYYRMIGMTKPAWEFDRTLWPPPPAKARVKSQLPMPPTCTAEQQRFFNKGRLVIPKTIRGPADIGRPTEAWSHTDELGLRYVLLFGDSLRLIPSLERGRKVGAISTKPNRHVHEAYGSWENGGATAACTDAGGRVHLWWAAKMIHKRHQGSKLPCGATTRLRGPTLVRVGADVTVVGHAMTVDSGSCEPRKRKPPGRPGPCHRSNPPPGCNEGPPPPPGGTLHDRDF